MPVIPPHPLRARFRFASGVLVVASLAVAGCATRGDGACKGGGGAAVGAVVGAVIGAVAGGQGGRTAGTIAGGILGAGAGAVICFAVDAQSQRTRSAAAVSADLQARGGVPPAPTVVQYQAVVSPPVVRPGDAVRVQSMVEVANGSLERVSELKEELILVDPEGQAHRLKTKDIADGGERAGRFANSFSFKFPSGVSPGTYTLRTALLVNGRPAGERQTPLRVVDAGSAAPLWAAASPL